MLIENLFSSEPEEEVFGNIVELIATLSETREDVQKILNDLLAADWDVILTHNLHYNQKAHEAYFHDWYCGHCHEHFPRSQMSKIPRVAQRDGSRRSQGRETPEETLALEISLSDPLFGGTLVSSSLSTLGEATLTGFVSRMLVTRALNARSSFLAHRA